MKIVLRLRHSSALSVPAAASPIIVGTDSNHDGVVMSLMTSLMRRMTSGVAIFREDSQSVEEVSLAADEQVSNVTGRKKLKLTHVINAATQSFLYNRVCLASERFGKSGTTG